MKTHDPSTCRKCIEAKARAEAAWQRIEDELRSIEAKVAVARSRRGREGE